MARFRSALKLDVQRFSTSVDHAVRGALVARQVRGGHLLALLGLIIASGAGILTCKRKPLCAGLAGCASH